MDEKAQGQIQSTEVKAVVFRADGTVEDLGTISYWHKNPLKRLQFKLLQRLTARN